MLSEPVPFVGFNSLLLQEDLDYRPHWPAPINQYTSHYDIIINKIGFVALIGRGDTKNEKTENTVQDYYGNNNGNGSNHYISLPGIKLRF